MFPVDGADNMDEFVVSNAIEREELEVEVLANFHEVLFVIGATLETVLVDDFDFIIDAKLSELFAHKGSIFFSGAVSGGWDNRDEFVGKLYVCFAKLDVEECGSGADDGGAVLVE